MSYENDLKVSTEAIAIFGDNAILSIGYWNDAITVRISATAIGINGKRSVDRDKSLTTVVGVQQIVTLIKNIREIIIPAMEAEEEKFVGVATGNSKLISIETRRDASGDIIPYLGLYEGVGFGKAPSKFNRFPLLDRYNNYFTSYNTETGELSKTSETPNGMLFTIIAVLKNSIMLAKEIHACKVAMRESGGTTNQYQSPRSISSNYSSNGSIANNSTPQVATPTQNEDLSSLLM